MKRAFDTILQEEAEWEEKLAAAEAQAQQSQRTAQQEANAHTQEIIKKAKQQAQHHLLTVTSTTEEEVKRILKEAREQAKNLELTDKEVQTLAKTLTNEAKKLLFK